MRLIRSKGVGVFFVTQVPDDIPGEVLGQLGSRVQHALRAFTPDDARALKAAASTYPRSDFYDVEELLTSMGIGEAAVTILSEDGVPTPVVHTRLRAPASRMGPADDVEAAPRRRPCSPSTAPGRRRRARARSSPGAWRRLGRARRRRPQGLPAEDARRISTQAQGCGHGHRRAAPTRSATSYARARARRSGARWRAGCSGCCARACERPAPPVPCRAPRAAACRDPRVRGERAAPPRRRVGGRALVSERGVHAHGRAGAAGIKYPRELVGAAATTSTTRCWPRSCRARARAGSPPGSARTSIATPQSGRTARTSRSSGCWPRPSAGRASPPWG